MKKYYIGLEIAGIILAITASCISFENQINYSHKTKLSIMKKVNVTEEPAFTMESIEGTPFHMVKHEEDHFVVMGKWRLTDKYATYEAARESMCSWGFHLAVITAVCEAREEAKKDSLTNQYNNNLNDK